VFHRSRLVITIASGRRRVTWRQVQSLGCCFFIIQYRDTAALTLSWEQCVSTRNKADDTPRRPLRRRRRIASAPSTSHVGHEISLCLLQASKEADLGQSQLYLNSVISVNPLMGTLKPLINGSLYNNTEMLIRFEEVLVQQPYYYTNMWNSLPDSVVMADTVNEFKSRLDKHWANYAFLYDYRVNYNGTGSLFVV